MSQGQGQGGLKSLVNSKGSLVSLNSAL